MQPDCFDGRFSDQRVIITGGAAGIGKAIAERMHKEGGHVILWDRDQEALSAARAELGDRVLTMQVDITDADAVQAAANSVAKELGGIDGLICSAGITGPNTSTWTYGVDDWKQVFDVNVHGLFYCNRACVPHMVEGGYGRIVNIASVAGKEGNPNASAYSASKAAVMGLTKSLGKELAVAKHDVMVNCVTPAAARTAIFDQMSEEHIAFMLSKVPMGRFALVEEIAALVCFLTSKECSFSTGSAFDISGGRSTY
ncbi:MAG: SDR family NAD(P)-dependent oxidoreductase [Hyphomicrobiales bacterium]